MVLKMRFPWTRFLGAFAVLFLLHACNLGHAQDSHKPPAFKIAQVGQTPAWPPTQPVVSAVTFAIQYGAYAENTSGTTSYSFSGVTIPATGANTYLVALVFIRSGSAISTPTVTIDPGSGAVATTLVSGSAGNNGAGPATYGAAFITNSAITSGSTATIAVGSFGSAAARAAVCLYSVTTASPTGTGSFDIVNANPNKTLTVTSGGGIIAGEMMVTVTSSTMTNLTQDHSALVGVTTTFVACGHDTSHAGASTTYTITNTPAPTAGASTFEYWGP